MLTSFRQMVRNSGRLLRHVCWYVVRGIIAVHEAAVNNRYGLKHVLETLAAILLVSTARICVCLRQSQRVSPVHT